MRFTKYHGLGNAYLVIEPSELGSADPALVARRLSDVNYGVGSDGILVGPASSQRADFSLRIFNPDGSEAEKSGNGLRIFARYLWDTQRVSSAEFTVETVGGLVRGQVLDEGSSVVVDMGRASFQSAVVGLTGPSREAVDETMDVAGEELRYCAVSIGNPHCVITRGAPATRESALRLGPIIEHEPRFANRTNVQFLEVLDRRTIAIHIWERGAGYTLASGSSSTAAACVAKRLGLCDGDITVRMPGGSLRIEVDDDFNARMTGPVARIASGIVASEALG